MPEVIGRSLFAAAYDPESDYKAWPLIKKVP
jgi:hypothetical protein